MVGHTVAVARFPFLTPEVLEAVALDGEDVVRAHQVPVALHVIAHGLPEEIRVADGGKYVMRLHAVVAVVCFDLEKLRQVLMPNVEIDRNRALPHAELIDRDGGVVCEANPADHAARRALEPADGAALRAHLAEIEPHTAAIFAHLRKVVDAAVDAGQAVRDGVDKAAGELMKRLSRVGERRGRHGHLERAEHFIKPPHPDEAIPRLRHSEMQRDTEIHLLRRLQRLTLVAADDIAPQQQLQTRIGELFVVCLV
ncbi:hypothetical protein SDC9_104141 [bioreactor metagenome]|uniref:Uncharacterized protein n=1 Tax=bioreactor metagenome TaxID=1076179 RepID=A0A645AW26_9ZZZZ